jgi:phasin
MDSNRRGRIADDSGFIVSESLTCSLNFRHGVCALSIFRVKILVFRAKNRRAGKYVAVQQKFRYRPGNGGRRFAAAPPKGKKMSNSPFEVPNEMRDFAERSVEQARKAFEGFLTVAQRASGVASEAAKTAPGVKSVGAHVLSYTERNVNAAFDLAQKLVKVKDPQEALALQSEYLKTQLAVLQEQAKELGSVMQKSLTPGSSS